MDYDLLKKQYSVIKEPMTKEEKKLLFQIILNKEEITQEEVCLYGEILEEKEEEKKDSKN